MPRILPDAPDLALSPDGQWAAALLGPSLCFYDLHSPARSPRGDSTQTPSDQAASDPKSPSPLQPVAELERSGQGGRLVFLDSERLLHVFVEPAEGSEPALIAAELIGIPSLQPVGALVRVAGAQRIVGVGPAGAVVAPNGPGADILYLRGSDLVLQRTFMRSEVLSAVPAPERRFLLEQRGGFDIWDPATRSALSRLVLQTRQVSLQIGYITSGRMLWALASGPPAHIEIFRASDGRRYLEMDQPGRGLGADCGPGRMVVAVEERSGTSFLDVELGSGSLARLLLPEGSGPLLSFAVRPAAATPEVLALTASHGTGLLRLALSRLQLSPSSEPADASHQLGQRDGRSTQRAHSDFASGRTNRLRSGRGEPRPDSRSDPRPDPRSDLPPARRPLPGSERRLQPPIANPPPLLLDETHEEPAAAAQTGPLPALAITIGDGDDPMPGRGGSASRRRIRATLSRSYDPTQSPASWQWELLRWAEQAISTEDGARQAPPDGGPLKRLGQRLRLTPIGHQLLALIYACQSLLGNRPHGLRLLELVSSLSGMYDEPLLLAELLPTAPLRQLGLVEVSAEGRYKLHGEVAALLQELPCPDLTPPTGSQRDLLPPGLYAHPGPFTRVSSLLGSQPLLRVSVLAVSKPLVAIERALVRALLYDAVVLIDGLPGVAYPAFSQSPLLVALRPLLSPPRVPVILCTMADAIPSLGLLPRRLPAELLLANAGAAAPLVPSSPLPVGTSWRSPMLPVSAAFLEAGAPSGRLELIIPGDRRAAIVVGANASPDAYAISAYLAARDGAILMADVELTSARILVLSMLLRQLPVTVTAIPPGGPGTPWPAALSPFAQ